MQRSFVYLGQGFVKDCWPAPTEGPSHPLICWLRPGFLKMWGYLITLIIGGGGSGSCRREKKTSGNCWFVWSLTAQNNQASIHSYFRASSGHESIWEKSWREPNPWQPYFPPPTGMPISLGFSNSLAPSKTSLSYLFWGARWACGAFSECIALIRVHKSVLVFFNHGWV